MRRDIPAIRKAGWTIFLLTGAAALAARAQDTAQQKLSNMDRAQAEEMLSGIHDSVKKNYYDPQFHGLDMDARYQKYEMALKGAPTLGEAFHVIAAYLSGLHDSHTFFIPPPINYRFDYGFRMQMIGDRCFITEVRPGSDAATRVHPGDEILRMGTYTVGRKDFRGIEYYLNSLSPQGGLDLQLRDPQGATRAELVRTKFLPAKKMVDFSFMGADVLGMILKQEGLIHLLRQRWVEMDDALILKIPAFNMTPDQVDSMMGKARKHAALILDLRGNPGGFVDSLTYLTGSFFDHEVTIGSPIGRKHDKEAVAKPHRKPFTGKLYVLVDNRSGSASELFARTIQLSHRGTVVGNLSAGAVMESRFYPLQIGVTHGNDLLVFYAASITHDDLIMPDGKSLEGVGVTPDVIVLPTGSDLATGRDPALAKAAELAGVRLDPAAAGKLFPFEWAPLQ